MYFFLSFNVCLLWSLNLFTETGLLSKPHLHAIKHYKNVLYNIINVCHFWISIRPANQHTKFTSYLNYQE